VNYLSLKRTICRFFLCLCSYQAFSLSFDQVFGSNAELEIKALNGDIFSQVRLGHQKFSQIPPKYKESKIWFEMAAARGHADSFFWLGNFFIMGLGTEQSDKKAVYFWESGASLDSINCIEALTLYYFENEDQLNGSAWLTLLLEKQKNHRLSGINGIKEETLQSEKIKSAIQKIQTRISNVKNAPTFDRINKNRKVEEVILKDGSKYLGQIIDGIPNGYGYKISSSGQSHLGYFDNGLENGLGKSINQDGIITYEGFWKDGIPIK